MDFYIIGTIARYEMRTLMRSWFFRIFVGLAIFGLGIYNLALNIDPMGSAWVYRAISASIPYANLIILNLGQAIVAVFLASEFLKQDLKNDTVEVIYVRSMSNMDYILGKTTGILSVFLVLNLLILALGIGFSFISNSESWHFFPYFAYPLLISLPTLIFILGLSFFIMVIVKNQAVTFILLLGYIALTVFYLNKKAFHLFDFIAYQVPMMYSSISGFGNLGEILVHRCIYMLLGAGLIFLTMYKLRRLPQSKVLFSIPLCFGIIFLLGGGFCIYRYLKIKQDIRTFRQQTLILNNRYISYPRVTVTSCRLNLEHRGNIIFANAQLVVFNPSEIPADTLIFSLNSGLELQRVTVETEKVRFKRTLQIIRIIPVKPLFPGDSVVVGMQYAGSINENACFLDKDPSEYEDNFQLEVFRLRKRFSFLQRNFVCLTRESQWYPVSGPGFSSDEPFRYVPDFTRFSLHVKTSPGLTAVSQGNVSEPDKGIYDFVSEYPLTGICLLIGDYSKFSLQVDSVEYSVYTIKRHEYFKTVFTDIADTLPTLIRGLKQEYEVTLGLKYPFRRFTLAEVPVHFALDNSLYDYSSNAVQPEMILYPEKGVFFRASDFKGLQNRRKKELKNNNEEALPEEIQSELFKQFIKVNFISLSDQNYNFGKIVSRTTFSLFPQYFGFITRLQSNKWPILYTAFEAYVSDRNNKAGSVLQWYEDLSQPERINLELASVSLSELLKKETDHVGKNNNGVGIRDVLNAKGNQLFNLLRARMGEREVDTLMTNLINSHQHKIIPFEELAATFEKRFKISLDEETSRWYSQRELPGFFISDMATYRVRDGEATRYQVKFTLSNPESTDGLVTLNVEMNLPNQRDKRIDNDFNIDFSRRIYIPSRSSFEIGFVFNSEPTRMSMVTHISRNLPYNLMINFPGFTEIRNVQAVDRVSMIPFKDNFVPQDEVIIDNENSGFSEQQGGNQAYLKSLVKTGKQNHYKYSSIHSWNPPREWVSVLRSEFYGRYIHSASYTRAGSGERTAAWVAHLPVKASYEVYFYLDKVNGMWQRNNKSPDYNFRVYHDQGIEKINRNSSDADDGWNYLGTYSFSSDSARVELTNQSAGGMIFADAVKWVRKK
jgi:hypothetical protein